MKHMDGDLRRHGQTVTYEGVEGRIGGHPSHFVNGLEREDVLVVVWAPQGAAGAAAGAQVTRRESGWSTWMKEHTHTNKSFKST